MRNTARAPHKAQEGDCREKTPPTEGRRQSGAALEKTTLSSRPQGRRGHKEEAILGS